MSENNPNTSGSGKTHGSLSGGTSLSHIVKKRKFIYLVALVLVVVGAGIAYILITQDDKKKGDKNTDRPWQSFSDGYFEFTYPPTWTVSSEKPPNYDKATSYKLMSGTDQLLKAYGSQPGGYKLSVLMVVGPKTGENLPCSNCKVLDLADVPTFRHSDKYKLLVVDTDNDGKPNSLSLGSSSVKKDDVDFNRIVPISDKLEATLVSFVLDKNAKDAKSGTNYQVDSTYNFITSPAFNELRAILGSLKYK